MVVQAQPLAKQHVRGALVTFLLEEKVADLVGVSLLAGAVTSLLFPVLHGLLP